MPANHRPASIARRRTARQAHTDDGPEREVDSVGPKGETGAVAAVVALQRSAGNRAVAHLVARQGGAHEGAGPGGAVGPKTAVAELGVRGVVDQLMLAIKLEMPGRLAIDVERMATALEGLTAAQGRAVREEFKRRHNLYQDLNDVIMGEGIIPNGLSSAQRKRLLNLLAGTVVDPQDAERLQAGVVFAAELASGVASLFGAGAASETQQLVAGVGAAFEENARRYADEQARGNALAADAAAVYAALRKGSGGHAAVFRLLDRPPDDNDALSATYEIHFHLTLAADVAAKLKDRPRDRAEALLRGDRVAAAAAAIEEQIERKRKAKADAAEVSDNIDIVREAVEKKVKESERQADALIEQALAELGTTSGAEAALARPAKSGRGTVGDELNAAASEATRFVVANIVEGDQAEIEATRLLRLETEGRLKAADLERALISLHGAAKAEVRASLAREAAAGAGAGADAQALLEGLQAKRDARLEETSIRLFTRFESRFDAGGGRTLRAVAGSVGSPVERDRNRELLAGLGRITADVALTTEGETVVTKSAEVKTLELAIRSKNMDRIRTAFAGRTKREVEALEAEYLATVGRPLRDDLIGYQIRVAPWIAEPEVISEKKALLEGDVFESQSGDPLAALIEEADWTLRRITALHDRVMDNRGLFAEFRDWVGNLEHDLVERALSDARKDCAAVKAALAGPTPDQAAAQARLEELRRSYARLERNLGAYKEATAEAFAAFVDFAVLVVSTIVTVGAGPAVAAIRAIASTVGTKLILKGEDYSLAEFRNDVLGGAAAAAGAYVGTKAFAAAFDEVAPLLLGAAKKAKLPVPPQFGTVAREGGGWVAGQEAASLASGQGFAGVGDLAQGAVTDLAGTAISSRRQAGVRRPPAPAGEPSTYVPHEPPRRGADVDPVAPRAAHDDPTLVDRPAPLADEPTLVEERMPFADEPTFVDRPPSIAEEPTLLMQLPEETVMQLADPTDAGEAREMYEKFVGDDPHREAAVYRNKDTGEYIVIQGGAAVVTVGGGEAPRPGGRVQRWKEVLNGVDVGSWELQRHSHPAGAGGVVDPVNMWPSGANGDMGAMVHEAQTSGQPRSSHIDYTTADGPSHTEFGFDPFHEQPLWIDLPDGAGGRLTKRFKTMESYHDFLENTLGARSQGEIPPHMSGLNPVASADPDPTAPRAVEDDPTLTPEEELAADVNELEFDPADLAEAGLTAREMQPEVLYYDPELGEFVPVPAEQQARTRGNVMDTIAGWGYPMQELALETRLPPTRRGRRRYVRVDNYNPATGEIVSRKSGETGQLAEVEYHSPGAGLDHLQELRVKYASGARIANVPSAGPLAGQRVQGTLVLEVPPQKHPIPDHLLDYAHANGIVIRDWYGRVYT